MAVSHGLLCDKLSWEQLEPLATGLWCPVFKLKQQDLVVKISKNTSNALFDTEKKVYEALGRSGFIGSYHGTTLVIERDGFVKPGLIIQHYELRTLKDFLNNPAASIIYDDHDQRLRNSWARQAIEAVIYIHSRDVIHGDLRIHNILVGPEYNLRLADFGGSSLSGNAMQVECSPRYHRPHSWRFPIRGIDDVTEAWKIPTPVMDTYALGTVLYEILTGAQLHKDKTYDEIRALTTQRRWPNLGVITNLGLRSIISKCWEEQYRSAQDILQEFLASAS